MWGGVVVAEEKEEGDVTSSSRKPLPLIEEDNNGRGWSHEETKCATAETGCDGVKGPVCKV